MGRQLRPSAPERYPRSLSELNRMGPSVDACLATDGIKLAAGLARQS